MHTRGALAVGVVAIWAALGGCGRSQTTIGEIVAAPALAQVQIVPVSTDSPAIVTLGAGDALGQRIHVVDVYLAARELIGPMLEPTSPPESLMVSVPFEPITNDIALAMVSWW